MSNIKDDQHPADRENRDLTMVERWEIDDQIAEEVAAKAEAEAAANAANQSNENKSDKSDDKPQ
ncbi:MAG: hypothetical protein AAFW70_01170 [Cyanobacteria bacterium J06635_10]